MEPRPDDLTKEQWEAVSHKEGPLLVLAGPGSGKTRVITRRIARLVETGVSAHQILAITFTNKASKEMARRVNELLPGSRVEISTFHKFCARVLRRYGSAVGLKQNFSICDTSDQKQLIKEAMHQLDIDPVHFPPAKVGHRISNAKNELLTAERYCRRYEDSVGNHMQAVVAKVYPRYQQMLLESNAVDFDDMLLHVAVLLGENPELRAGMDDFYQYVLVDEYQDTNMAQYQIVAALSQNTPNLCVTGDPDQSIYGWRGAQIENILRFERDFDNVKIVRLEKNYRSTPNILKAADSLIANNVHRKAKSLIAENPEGEPVELLNFYDGPQEAGWIAQHIRHQVETGERDWSDFAIFYRINALSRSIELALLKHQVPYQVASGLAFYERAEVKTMLAYLRLVHNPADRAAFMRIVNTPARGIGKKTVTQLVNWADTEGFTLLDAAAQAAQHPNLKARPVKLLTAFAEMMQQFSLADSGSIAELLKTIIDRTMITAPWMASHEEKDQQRLANVEELLTAAKQFDREFEDDVSLETFLESTSLAGDADQLEDNSGRVTLMTLHAAKGLEYPVVYVVAVEQNLLPHERSLQSGELHELEEERRLLFVGVTRAEEKLYLTQTYRREFRGQFLHTIPSDFLNEMELVRIDLIDQEFDPAASLLQFAAEPEEKSESKLISQGFGKPLSLPPIMTGAELLNKRANSETAGQSFSVGMQVRHPRLGLGTVVDLGGSSRMQTVTVEFDSAEPPKKFVAAKCPLQPVGIH